MSDKKKIHPSHGEGKRKFTSHKQPDFKRDREQAPKPYNPELGEESSEFSLSSKMTGTVSALIELDQDLMKLLVRRAKLVSRIYEGKDHPSSPSSIVAEKTVRKAWEKSAPSFSKDTKFSRQLFSLLQELKVFSKDDTPKDNYRLSPSSKPVSGAITGPISCDMALMWIALACCKGEAMTLQRVPMNNALADGIKLFNQAGSTISWEPSGATFGVIRVEAGTPASFSGKNIYVGDSLFCLYLAAFIAAKTPGTCRLTGGSILKNADLTPLRKTLPFLGARLAHVVPHSHGLPANIECSGSLPVGLTVPADLPSEGLNALLFAPLVWDTAITINLESLPAVMTTEALARLALVYASVDGQGEACGAVMKFTPSEIHVPKSPELHLDPILCAYLLAIPAFSSGSLTIFGNWPVNMPDAIMARHLLEWCGLSIQIEKNCIRAEKTGTSLQTNVPAMNLPDALSPLFFALLARARFEKNEDVFMPSLVSFDDDNAAQYGNEMFEKINLLISDELAVQAHTSSEKGQAWAPPSPHWAMAYALCSLNRPGLKLINPSEVSALMPSFWTIFNSLPHLCEPSETIIIPPQEKSEPETDDKKNRRRIITH